MQSSVLLAHIVSQTRQNIDFLISQNIISRQDASLLLSKLDDSSLANNTQNLTMPSPEPTAAASVPHPSIGQARALWDYNEQGLEQTDLSFRAGDIIEIMTETNADWWTGRLNNKQGLFPSNYVEKINKTCFPTISEKPSYSLTPSAPPYSSQGAPPYQPVAGYQGPLPPSNYSGQSPPQQVPYNMYSSPAAPAPQPQAPPKKGRLGGLGNTLAVSAVGGAGFGAGSAIGSGLVNAIF